MVVGGDGVQKETKGTVVSCNNSRSIDIQIRCTWRGMFTMKRGENGDNPFLFADLSFICVSFTTDDNMNRRYMKENEPRFSCPLFSRVVIELDYFIEKNSFTFLCYNDIKLETRSFLKEEINLINHI